ncbi:MAG: hypothetical protein PHT58_05560 [Eubacteriales bacterium]|nr:hypothetical protein [Eubacteriales bacterium]
MRRALAIFLILILLTPSIALGNAVDLTSAKAAIIAPLQSDMTIEQKNETEQYNVAGLCKLPAILTLSIAFDKGVIEPQAQMQVSHKASGISGPTAFLESSEVVAAEELIKAAVMISAGDAIYTLGENAFGSEQVFLQNIEVTLDSLGLDVQATDCLFSGCTFTAEEMLTLAQAAAQSQTFLKYCGVYMDELVHADGRRTELVNANRMIRNYSGCFGLMTGSSKDDGYCGVFVAKRNDMCYVCVVIGSKNSEDRFNVATSLFDYAFSSFRIQTLATAYTPLLKEVLVRSGDPKSVDLVSHETAVILQRKDEGELEKVWEIAQELQAPLYADVSVGMMTVRNVQGETLCQIPIYPAVDVQSYGTLDILRRLARNFLGC